MPPSYDDAGTSDDQSSIVATYLPDGRNQSLTIDDGCDLIFNYESSYNDAGLIDLLRLEIDHGPEEIPLGSIRLRNLETRVIYENSLIQKTIATENFAVGPDGVIFSRTIDTTYFYRADGFLSRVENKVRQGGELIEESIRTIAYEERYCAPQLSTHPLIHALGELPVNRLPLESESGLRCGYLLVDILDQ